ncbi:hypothetical protein ACLOJK_021000 [Asimina triloba]
MVTKQSAVACCSLTSTGAKASSTTTTKARQAATTGAEDPSTTPKADPLRLFNSPCFAAVNKSESSRPLPSNIAHLKKKSDWERYWKDSQKSCQKMVIIFTATWFQPAGYNAEEEMKSLATKFKEVRFAKVDVDHLMDVAKERKVESILTFVLLKQAHEDEGKKENEKDAEKEGAAVINETKDGTPGKAGAAATSTSKKGNKSKEGHTSSLKEIGRVNGHEKEVFTDIRELIENN